jgi:hypothetical protein
LPPSVVATALLDRIFQLLDLFFVFDLYEAVTNAFSPGLRKLTAEEFDFLYPVFGRSVPYDRIRIDERAHFGPRRYRFLYVSFHTINSWGPISPPTLVHEVVHVWQYVHRGAIYIPRALAAQYTEAGYDYGGAAGLQTADCLDDFNYEQMACVIEDAFRLAEGFRPRWVREGVGEVLSLYRPFLRELRGGR